MKYLLPLLGCLLVSLSARAGHLNAVHIGCGSCGNNAFLLDWGGSWSRPRQLLDYRPRWSARYIYYAGYVPPAGVDASPVYDARYRIVSCAGQDCTPEAMAFVPMTACRPVR